MKVYSEKEIPQLNEPQCSIVQAEIATGIILTVEGQRYDKETDEPFILIFNSLDEAKSFSEKKVIENPNLECNIYNFSANFIEVVFEQGNKSEKDN